LRLICEVSHGQSRSVSALENVTGKVRVIPDDAGREVGDLAVAETPWDRLKSALRMRFLLRLPLIAGFAIKAKGNRL
jgi:hypothetical protein